MRPPGSSPSHKHAAYGFQILPDNCIDGAVMIVQGHPQVRAFRICFVNLDMGMLAHSA